MHPIRPWLYVGKFRETQDEALLRQQEIGGILQLADHVNSPNIPSLYISVEDGVALPFNLLKRGIEFARLAQWRLRSHP